MKRLTVPGAIAAAAIAVVALGALMIKHARAGVNHVALSSSPKLATVAPATTDTFRPSHRYIATLEPWTESQVGPQLIATYVETVLVRPGAVVKRGDVIATLDCRNASASMQAVTAQAHALETTQAALANESARVSSLLQGGYASPDEVEQKKAESESKAAQLLAVQAQMAGTSLEVSDCILRAPFDAEVADRQVDPGAFVRPGSAIATLVDRGTVRVVADVPEDDFGAVAPETPVRVKIVATGAERAAKVSRRAPAADPTTRTVHVEIDLPNDDHAIPVGTTADLEIDVGAPQPALRVPLTAATVKNGKATLFVVGGDGIARRVVVKTLGERTGDLFLATSPELAAGAQVVVEGRGALVDGDRVDVEVAK